MKVIITGIECSGKSTLAVGLAAHYGVTHLPEYARAYLMEHGSNYTELDLLSIAHGQLNQEREASSNGVDPIICDTSLLVIKIWSEIRFGRCHPWIIDNIAQQDWDLFLLCDHHIPLEADPLRDYDLDRNDFHDRYRAGLLELDIPYHDVSGTTQQRINAATRIIATYK